jgi:hypothetical protein
MKSMLMKRHHRHHLSHTRHHHRRHRILVANQLNHKLHSKAMAKSMAMLKIKYEMRLQK